LVIYRGEFEAGTSLPLDVEILIPAEAGEPSAVAYQDDQGSLLTLDYMTERQGGELAVRFELPSLAFQLEYYRDDLVGAEPGARDFEFVFTPDYAIQSLRLDFLQPPGATGFSVSPPADETETAGGLTYAVINRTDLPAGETLTWEISYTKADSSLVVVPTPAEQPLAPSTKTGGGGGLTTLWLVLGVVGVAIVGAGAYWLGRRQSAPTRRRAATHQRDAYRTADAGWRDVEGAPFCHKCGTRLKPGAEFCHQCGTRVKSTT
jgi:hypothetical protein